MKVSGSHDNITLRPETAQDEPFNLELFSSTRTQELEALGLPAEMQSAFLKMQFKAHEGYRAAFPKADFLIVQLNGVNIGRMIVDRAEAEFRLVDLAMLPDYRNAGVGTALIRKLQAEAAVARKPLRLTVRKSSPAARLYLRLGFMKTAGTEMDDEMECRPDSMNIIS